MKDWKEIVIAMTEEIIELKTRGVNPTYLDAALVVLDSMIFNESGETEDVEPWYELIAVTRRQINKEVNGK